jgi:hypothetical protein
MCHPLTLEKNMRVFNVFRVFGVFVNYIFINEDAHYNCHAFSLGLWSRPRLGQSKYEMG